MTFDTTEIVFSVIKMVIVLSAMLSAAPMLGWVERRGSALIQDRPGPNRVGPFGLLQLLIDAVKFIFKEDITPAESHKWLHTLAPMFGLLPGLTTIAVVPWGRDFILPANISLTTPLAIILAVVAVGALLGGVYIAIYTRNYMRRPPAIKLNAFIGWVVVAVLFVVALAAVVIYFGLKSAGDVAVPGAGRLFQPIIADLNIGLLLVFALASLGVYGVTIAGWSSNNKYSLMGGLRASAQMISYELSLALAAVGTLMAAGSLRLVDVVGRQTGSFVLFDTIHIPAWNFIPMFIGFVTFTIAGFAETNRLPFDLPEAEAELVAGYHTEYSSMKFAMFPMAEYMAMTTMSALIVTLFLGGWDIPWYHEPATFVGFLLSALAFSIKVVILLLTFVWVRWTLPRFRYDQLMRLGWKVMLPLAILNIVLVAILIPLRMV